GFCGVAGVCWLHCMAVVDPQPPPAKVGGLPRTTDLREVLNALRAWLRSGAARGGCPHGLGHRSASAAGSRGLRSARRADTPDAPLWVGQAGIVLCSIHAPSVTARGTSEQHASPRYGHFHSSRNSACRDIITSPLRLRQCRMHTTTSTASISAVGRCPTSSK